MQYATTDGLMDGIARRDALPFVSVNRLNCDLGDLFDLYDGLARRRRTAVRLYGRCHVFFPLRAIFFRLA
jgi:hypothetical protein